MDDVGFLLRHADYRTTQRVYVHTKAIDIKTPDGGAVVMNRRDADSSIDHHTAAEESRVG
jgi:hypothetical protein